MRPQISIRHAAAGLPVALLLAACSSAGASQSGLPSSGPSGSGQPSGSAGPAPSLPAGFYLRAWQTQALEPHQTFTQLPILTIANGTAIDGRIIMPLIYPGPLYASPFAKTITQKGIAAIVDEARKDGLLAGRTDYTDNIPPGGAVAHVEMVVDGTRYELAGDPDKLTRCRCIPDPGTPAAFAAFYQRLSGLDQWLPNELGDGSDYIPERLAVVTVKPVDVQGPIEPTFVAWPLATDFEHFGTAFGSSGDRCSVVSGADLQKLLPAVENANQLTRFTDTTGARKSLLVRALVPGEPSPCYA